MHFWWKKQKFAARVGHWILSHFFSSTLFLNKPGPVWLVCLWARTLWLAGLISRDSLIGWSSMASCNDVKFKINNLKKVVWHVNICIGLLPASHTVLYKTLLTKYFWIQLSRVNHRKSTNIKIKRFVMRPAMCFSIGLFGKKAYSSHTFELYK